jgi:predicted nucleotidyltransferase
MRLLISIFVEMIKKLSIMRRPEIVEKIRGVMHANFPQTETYLYGSEARGDARPDSDFDLLVLVPDELNDHDVALLRMDVFGKLYDIMLNDLVDIAPLILRHRTWNERKTPFTANVMREGVLL